MLKSVDSPLYHVFEQIVSEERRLPAVDSLSYEDERGLMGWVHGKRVLVGNRNLLENHGVTPPDRSVELEHTQNGRQVTYIASAGRACSDADYQLRLQSRHEAGASAAGG